MLYETCARAEEILGINIEELDLAGRRTPVKAVSPRDVCRTLGWPGFRTGRPARYWTSTRPSAGRRPDSPRRGRFELADADGQVPAPKGGERPPVLPSLGRGDCRAHQHARSRRH